MDNRVKSVPVRAPWWFTAIQLAPLVLQLASEIVFRIQGGPSIDGAVNLVKVEVPVPEIVSEPDSSLEK